MRNEELKVSSSGRAGVAASEPHAVLLQEVVEFYMLLKFCKSKVLFQLAKEKCFLLLVKLVGLASCIPFSEISTYHLPSPLREAAVFWGASPRPVSSVFRIQVFKLHTFRRTSWWWQMMSCSALSKPVRDLLLFSQGTVHQAQGWAALQGLRDKWQSLRHLEEFELGWVTLCLYHRQGIADLMCSFQHWILRKKKLVSRGSLWNVSMEAGLHSALLWLRC